MTINFNSIGTVLVYAFLVAVLVTAYPFHLLRIAGELEAGNNPCIISSIGSILAALFTRSLPLAFFISSICFYLKRISYSLTSIVRIIFFMVLIINIAIIIRLQSGFNLLFSDKFSLFMGTTTLVAFLIAGLTAQNAVSIPEPELTEVYYSDLTRL